MQSMTIIAHRGACTEALENSWEAFHKAVEIGAQRIELDVHLTSDGHLLVMHDEDLKRTADSPRLVRACTRDEIARDIKLTNGERVPFLDEVLAEFLDKIEFNIEIKSPGPQTVEAVARLCLAQKDLSRLIISSFHLPTCEHLAKKFPQLKTALLWDKKLWWPWSFAWGPLRFMKRNQIRIFHPDAHLVEPTMVKELKARGWEIFPYVGLKREHQARELWTYLMTCGVDGLCTNYPREMKLWLQEATDDFQRFRDFPSLANRSS